MRGQLPVGYILAGPLAAAAGPAPARIAGGAAGGCTSSPAATFLSADRLVLLVASARFPRSAGNAGPHPEGQGSLIVAVRPDAEQPEHRGEQVARGGIRVAIVDRAF